MTRRLFRRSGHDPTRPHLSLVTFFLLLTSSCFPKARAERQGTEATAPPFSVVRLRSLEVGPGSAAAGGVGQILCQWAKALGATVIGTVGSDAKAVIAKKCGCKHVIVIPREDLVARVKAITKGKGVPVVYDGIGKDTWDASLDCLAPRGMMVSFGNASGPVTQINPGILAAKGSLFLTRPTLFHYVASRPELLAAARDLFSMIKSKKVKISVNQTYPLRDAARAQADLESRKTTGSTVLIP